MTAPISTARLKHLFVTRQQLRLVYLAIAEQCDVEPHNSQNTELVNCVHSLFRALTIIDDVLDNNAVTLAMAKGAFEHSNKAIKAINAAMREEVRA